MKCRVPLSDQLGSNSYGVNMDDLSPIEIRIRRLVEDLFANRITLYEFKWELNRVREKFDRGEKTNRKARRKRSGRYIPAPQEGESSHAVHPQH